MNKLIKILLVSMISIVLFGCKAEMEVEEEPKKNVMTIDLKDIEKDAKTIQKSLGGSLTDDEKAVREMEKGWSEVEKEQKERRKSGY